MEVHTCEYDFDVDAVVGCKYVMELVFDDDLFRNVVDAQNTPYTLHSVMREYLTKHSPVTPTPPLNAKILDAPQTLLTQVSGVDYQFT